MNMGVFKVFFKFIILYLIQQNFLFLSYKYNLLFNFHLLTNKEICKDIVSRLILDTNLHGVNIKW